MSIGRQRNDTSVHNATITRARPYLLIPATKEDHNGFAVRMSAAGPRRVPADIEGTKFYADWGLEGWQPVKEFEVGFLKEKKDQNTLRGLVLLRGAHEESSKNRAAAEDALARAAELLVGDPLLQPVFRSGKPRDVAGTFYPAFFSREMRNAQVVIWRTGAEEFLPAILCDDARTASFVAAAFRGLAVCPNCLKLFDPYGERVDGSSGDKYCTAVCGSRYRQKLYRQRVSVKASTKKSKGRKPTRRRQ
jgi:hypothetical protein